MDLYEGLNDRQREAVDYLNGPLLILAGAGSGKTKTIITRIAHILEGGYAWPSEILAITFTNKAAGEMRERIAALDIEDTDKIWMSTFHSACARILRMHADKLGYTRHFKILDSDDQKSIVNRLIKEAEYDPKRYAAGKIVGQISKYKNAGTTPKELGDSAVTSDDIMVAQIYDKYVSELKRLDSMDFDDLLIKTNELLRNEPEVREKLQNKFKYILVDEYQDSNKSQYEFVQMLAQGHKNLCVCGDDDQSIVRPYGGRVHRIGGAAR